MPALGITRFRAILTLATFVAGCASEPAAVCTLTRAATLPLESHGSEVGVAVAINGVPARLAVDTGATRSLIFANSGARLKLFGHSYGVGNAGGIGGYYRTRTELVRDFRLGNLHDHSVLLDVRAEKPTSRPEWDDGLLGRDLLAQYDIDFDLPGKRLMLFGFEERCGTPSARLQPPLFPVPFERAASDTAFRVTVLLDGKPMNAVLDSGAGSTVLFRRAAARLGFTPDPRDRRAKAHGLGPRAVDSVLHRFGEVQIGDLSLTNVPVSVLSEDLPYDYDTDMLIGLDTMKLIHVWVSNSSRSLILQYPPQRSPDPPG